LNLLGGQTALHVPVRAPVVASARIVLEINSIAKHKHCIAAVRTLCSNGRTGGVLALTLGAWRRGCPSARTSSR